MDISSAQEPVHSKPFTATCTATLRPLVASHLIQYLTINWVRGDGQLISQDDRITIEDQQTLTTSVSKALVFNPLDMAHGGDYICEAKLTLTDSGGSFNSTYEYHLNVLSKSDHYVILCIFIKHI